MSNQLLLLFVRLLICQSDLIAPDGLLLLELYLFYSANFMFMSEEC
jgi:hypothetical protein